MSRAPRATRRTLLTAAALLVLARTSAANPADVVGLGARGAAMAGAQVAAASDGTASYYNPARLALGDDIRLDLGYQASQPVLGADGARVDIERSQGTVITLAIPGRVAGRRLAIGAAVFLPDQHLTRTRALPATLPRFIAYDNRPQRLFLAATAALAITPTLTVGGGLSYMSSTVGTVELHGLVGFPDPDRSELDLAIDVDLRTIRYPHAGISWQATPWLTVAASYRGGFRLRIDQTFDIRGDVGTPGMEPVVDDGFFVLRSVSQDLFQPAQATVGIAAQVTPRLLVAFDAAYHRWSAYEHPAAHLDLDLDVGDFNDQVNIPPPLVLPEPHLHDILVPRLGLEYAATPSWTARAGYAYEPTAAPRQHGESNFIDNDKHTVSAGGGFRWPGLGGVILKPVELDAFVAVTMLPSRAHTKLSPIDPVGSYEAGGWVLAAGLTSRWRF